MKFLSFPILFLACLNLAKADVNQSIRNSLNDFDRLGKIPEKICKGDRTQLSLDNLAAKRRQFRKSNQFGYLCNHSNINRANYFHKHGILSIQPKIKCDAKTIKINTYIGVYGCEYNDSKGSYGTQPISPFQHSYDHNVVKGDDIVNSTHVAARRNFKMAVYHKTKPVGATAQLNVNEKNHMQSDEVELKTSKLISRQHIEKLKQGEEIEVPVYFKMLYDRKDADNKDQLHSTDYEAYKTEIPYSFAITMQVHEGELHCQINKKIKTK